MILVTVMGVNGQKHIVAMGGGGFSMESDNPLLDKYVLGLTNKSKPKICFIGTASGDAQSYIDRFYASFKNLNCEPTHLSLFKGSTPDVETLVMNQDALYVGGGNTRNLLTLWKDWGLDLIVRKAWEKGIILSGISAGSLCWFEHGITDSIPGSLSALSCLGLLKGSNCPHYDGEKERRPTFHRLLTEGKMTPGLAADDGVALHFVGDIFSHAVSSHPDKKAFRVGLRNGQPYEETIQPTYLGGNDLLIRRAAIQDARAIHEAHMRSIREVCAPDYTREEVAAWGGREYREDIRLTAIKNDHVWVIENQGKIEGYGHLIMGSGEKQGSAHVLALYLTPAVIDRGLGHRLLTLMEDSAKEGGAKTMSLESTINSLPFYRSHGFTEVGSQLTVTINGAPVRCHPMEKRYV